MAHLPIPRFADLCVVDLVDERGHITRSAFAHVDPARQQALQNAAGVPIDYLTSDTRRANVLRSGKAVLETESSEADILGLDLADRPGSAGGDQPGWSASVSAEAPGFGRGE